MTTALTTALAKSLAAKADLKHCFEPIAKTGFQYEAKLTKLGTSDVGMAVLVEIEGVQPTYIGLWFNPAAKPEHQAADIAMIECIGLLLGRKKSAKALITLRATSRAAHVQQITQRERNPFCPATVHYYAYIDHADAI